MSFSERISEDKRKWWILAAMTAAVSMLFVDISVLPVALPTISRDLGISNLGLQWIVNAYTLALTVLVLAGGRVADIWGLKKGFCVGLSLFTLASLLCGFAQTTEWLIFSRALQGAGGALMLPSTQAIVVSAFPPHQRGKAVGIYVSVGSLFFALGPLIGGSLSQYLNWRYIFWVNLPIAAIGMTLALLCVPSFEKRRLSFDWLGFVTLGIGVSSLVVAVMNIQLWGVGSPQTLFLGMLGIFLITLLLRTERKIPHPLLELSLIKRKSFASSASVIFCNQFLLMVTVFWALYFQDVLNFSPVKAGVVVLISNAPALFTAPLAGVLVDRLGPRIPVTIGFSCIIFSLIWFLFYRTSAHVGLLLPALIPFGCGMYLVFTPSFVSLMNDIPAEKRGTASGINASLRQLGATLGLAVFGALFQQRYHGRFSQGLDSSPLTAHLDPRQFEGLLSHNSGALHALKKYSSAVATQVHESLVHAYVSALDLINFLAMLCAGVGIFLALKYLKNTPVGPREL